MRDINRSCIERAIGIIEGVSYAVDSKISDCLINVVEMLDSVIEDEERNE